MIGQKTDMPMRQTIDGFVICQQAIKAREGAACSGASGGCCVHARQTIPGPRGRERGWSRSGNPINQGPAVTEYGAVFGSFFGRQTANHIAGRGVEYLYKYLGVFGIIAQPGLENSRFGLNKLYAVFRFCL